MEDRWGDTLTYTWTSGELDSVSHSGGPTLTYTWDTGGRVAQVEDDDGNAVTYSYSGAGYLQTVASGTSWTLSYTDGLLTRIRSGTTDKLTATYDAYGRLLTRSVAGLSFTESTDLSSGERTVTDGAGVSNTWSYESQIYTGYTDGAGESWSVSYDSSGLLDEVSDPLGNTVSYTYDSFDLLSSTTDAEGNQTRYWYDWTYGEPVLAAWEEPDGSQFYVWRDTDGRVEEVLPASLTLSGDTITGISITGDALVTYSWSDGKMASMDLNGPSASKTYDTDGSGQRHRRPARRLGHGDLRQQRSPRHGDLRRGRHHQLHLGQQLPGSAGQCRARHDDRGDDELGCPGAGSSPSPTATATRGA